jgi:hypothetical protein
MEIPNSDWLSILANGGISLIIFVIWYVTFKTINKQYIDLVERLFKQIEQDLQYKELLTGIMTKLETKIDAFINSQRGNK